MENYDIILLNIYLLTIFSLVVRAKINTATYRVLKLVVFLMFGVFIYELFSNVPSIDNRVMMIVRIIPAFVVFLVLVHSEFKSMMDFIGIKSGLKASNTIEEASKTELLHAIDYLSRHKIGAIITFERSTSLQDYIENAFQIEAPLSSELLGSIFMPKTPLHDGAIIIKDNIIKCAGAYFPPSESGKIPKYLGSRHRAGIGISEITDSLTVIVSEESGQVSVAINGYLDQDLSHESLVLYLEKYLQQN